MLAAATTGAAASREGPSCTPVREAGMQACTAGLPVWQVVTMGQQQRASRWCWAAVVSMLLHRHGVSVPQEAVVRAWYGSAVNEAVDAATLARLLARTWQDAAGRAVTLAAEALPHWELGRGLLAPAVLAELAQGRPVVLGSRGHAMVLVEVAWERDARGVPTLLRAVVLDPAAPLRVRELEPHEAQVQHAFLVRADLPSREPLVPTALRTSP